MEVMIEIGHKAWKNIKPTKEGYTHDWTVFVQGVNGNEIKHIVDKVIFHLPDSYQDSKKIREKPPFTISESTSESIFIQIDVFFCAEARLGKVNYIYDVHISDKDVNISCIRKLKFSNPSKEFKEKLLSAGGKEVDLQQTLPVIMEKLQNCQVEPDNEIIILNNVDGDTTLNTTDKKLDNLQELLRENKNLKSANVEIKEKIGCQEKILTSYEENFSYYEAHILKTNMGINQLQKKLEDDEKEISTLKLRLKRLMKELLQIKNTSAECPRGKKRKHEDLCVNGSVSKEKLNIVLATKFTSSCSKDNTSISEISSSHQNTSVPKKNKKIEKVKLSSVTPTIMNTSQSKIAVTFSCFPSQPKNVTKSLNKSTHQQNFSSCINNEREIVYFGDVALNPCNKEFLEEQKEKEQSKTCLPNSKNCDQKENLHKKSCERSLQDKNDTSAPKLVDFFTKHCLKLATELNRINNSKFSNYRDGTNSLFFKLANMDTDPITEVLCKEYLDSLNDYFTNPETFDLASLIYIVVDYLYRDRLPIESLPTYIQNENTLAYLTPSENCIIAALHQVDHKSLPHLNGLIRNTLNIIQRVIISKKNLAMNGLASVCRVFMGICRCSNDRWRALFLCCELLRLGHPLAPYLINSLAAVWRDPFKFLDNSTVEKYVLGAIVYGMKEKPTEMDYNLWKLTQKLRSMYFPRPFIVDHNQAIQLLKDKIVSRCSDDLFENLWMLASPLVIFVSKETSEWKMNFKNNYILPNLLHFSKCLKEHAFRTFCNLYVDIFSFCDEGLYKEMLQYFNNTSLQQEMKFIKDCAAVTLLKYLGITNKSIPKPVRDWFLRNQDNPKLALVLDLYCKKVMESHDSSLLWDDVIIL